MSKPPPPLVGVAIATHNDCGHLRQCLQALETSDHHPLHVVVVDDGSTDDTWKMLRQEFPNVQAIRGDGNLWWAGATNRAIRACLAKGSDYILLLNPDVEVTVFTVSGLLATAQHRPKSIIASLLVRADDVQKVFWSGSTWGPIFNWLPVIWLNRSLYKSGWPVDAMPPDPYPSSEAHGRGVLIPAEIFEEVGLYDEKYLPQYGADTDFSFRARRAGYSIIVDPRVRVCLDTENTGVRVAKPFTRAWHGYWSFLTKRKNGEVLRVYWHVLRRHAPRYAFIPTYVFTLLVTSYQYWSRALSTSPSRRVLSV